MEHCDLAAANRVQTNLNVSAHGFISMQLSYSTADIEKSIFYAPEYTIMSPSEPLGKATILVVHGEMFSLEEAPAPVPSVPLTEQSGLFRIIEQDQRA